MTLFEGTPGLPATAPALIVMALLLGLTFVMVSLLAFSGFGLALESLLTLTGRRSQNSARAQDAAAGLLSVRRPTLPEDAEWAESCELSWQRWRLSSISSRAARPIDEGPEPVGAKGETQWRQ